MRLKAFVILAAVTVATVVAAGAAYLGEPRPASVEASNEPAFPELGNRLNDVARITIATAEGDFTLSRTETGDWVAEDKFGYPVAEEKVRELVLGLSDLRLAEAKTARPDRYDRLEVEAVDAKDAQSRRVSLESANGEVLADVLVGKRKYSMTGGERGGTYIRLMGVERAWLAAGEVTVDGAVGDWLVRRVVDVPSHAVRRIEIRHPDGKKTVAFKEGHEDDTFDLDGVPEDRAVDPAALDRLAAGLSALDFDDVKPADEVAFPEMPHVATFTTFDGTVVRAELAKIGDKHWLRLSAERIEAAPAKADRSPEQVATAEDQDVAEASDPSADEAQGAQQGEQPADPGISAAEINKRIQGWAYEIPVYTYDRLTQKVDELLKPKDDGTS